MLVECGPSNFIGNSGDITTVVEAITRSSNARSKIHPLVVPKLEPIKVARDNFLLLQATCPSLEQVRHKAENGEIETYRNGSRYKFVYENELIYRECVHSPRMINNGTRALMVPDDCRKAVLTIAHESPLAGHFSHKKKHK